MAGFFRDYKILPVSVFALLVGDCTGSLACGLAGRLALTAAALYSAFLQVGLIQSFDLLHGKTPHFYNLEFSSLIIAQCVE